jgi:hypothetical protein
VVRLLGYHGVTRNELKVGRGNCPGGVRAVDWSDIASHERIHEHVGTRPSWADDRAVGYLLLARRTLLHRNLLVTLLVDRWWCEGGKKPPLGVRAIEEGKEFSIFTENLLFRVVVCEARAVAIRKRSHLASL